MERKMTTKKTNANICVVSSVMVFTGSFEEGLKPGLSLRVNGVLRVFLRKKELA
jgi:hypothetical protein